MQHKMWEAMDILKKDGWCKNLQVNNAGEHCIAGAVMAARGISGAYWLYIPERKLLDGVLNDLYPGFTVAGFNDDPDTTLPMVLEVMEKAAIRGDEFVDESTSTDRYGLGEQL